MSAERRASSPTFAESERRAAGEGGGYVVERMIDEDSDVLPEPEPEPEPELVAQGDENGPLPLDQAPF